MSLFAAFVSGALFALGLSLSGMTEPSRVIGFLDLSGAWDPSLAFVMGGAVTVYAILYRLIRARAEQPLLAEEFHVPLRGKVDVKLLVGATLFGAGWGLAGLCPGPAIVALGAAKPEAALFTLAMVVGSWLTSLLTRPTRARTSGLPSRALANDDA
ncbi:MAG: hypothetical protein RLZZ450_2947 [Pseudomonadota bacterium]|jgi:uncharacterized membrane protein YedE/YeeE